MTFLLKRKNDKIYSYEKKRISTYFRTKTLGEIKLKHLRIFVFLLFLMKQKI
jgi:hypothetical protein